MLWGLLNPESNPLGGAQGRCALRIRSLDAFPLQVIKAVKGALAHSVWYVI